MSKLMKMPHDKQFKDEWFESPAGQNLLNSEACCLAKIICSKWGTHLAQIGGPKSKVLRDVSPIIHQLCLNDRREKFEEASLVQVDYEELALLPNSVDVILMPHLLERLSRPEVLLAESYQALKPEGLLILFNFNPSGLGSLWYWYFKRRGLMTKIKWRSTYRLREMLHKSGFSQIQQWSEGFLPACKKKDKKKFGERILLWLFPALSAVTILVAKKEVTDPLLTVEWNTKPSLGVLQNQTHE